jgi:hypothetical protein
MEDTQEAINVFYQTENEIVDFTTEFLSSTVFQAYLRANAELFDIYIDKKEVVKDQKKVNSYYYESWELPPFGELIDFLNFIFYRSEYYYNDHCAFFYCGSTISDFAGTYQQDSLNFWHRIDMYPGDEVVFVFRDLALGFLEISDFERVCDRDMFHLKFTYKYPMYNILIKYDYSQKQSDFVFYYPNINIEATFETYYLTLTSTFDQDDSHFRLQLNIYSDYIDGPIVSMNMDIFTYFSKPEEMTHFRRGEIQLQIFDLLVKYKFVMGHRFSTEPFLNLAIDYLNYNSSIKFYDKDGNYLAKGVYAKRGQNVALKVVFKDGSYFWFRDYISSIVDRLQPIIGYSYFKYKNPVLCNYF